MQSLQGLDLCSLRMVANGAEPVSVPTLRRFIERFGRYGFRPGAMAPVYGLAENAVGLAFPPAGRTPVIDRVDREALSRARHRRARTGRTTRIRSRSSACGQPLPGHEIRIVDELGCEARRAARGPARVPRAIGDLRLFPQRDQDARAFPRRLARQRRPRLHGWRRGLHHRPDQGHHHPRRPPHLSAGDRRSRRRNPGHSQGMRGGVRRGRSRIRHRTGGRSGRDARERSCCPRGAAGARARGREPTSPVRRPTRSSLPRRGRCQRHRAARSAAAPPRSFTKPGASGRRSARCGGRSCACRLPASARSLAGLAPLFARRFTPPGGGSWWRWALSRRGLP